MRGGLGRDLGCHVDGLARHHDEAAVVLPSGELLGQHVQAIEPPPAALPMAAASWLASHDLHHGAGGGVADFVARPFQLAGGVMGALLEHLGMGVEGLDVFDPVGTAVRMQCSMG